MIHNWKFGNCNVVINFIINYGMPSLNNIEIVDDGNPVRSGMWGDLKNNQVKTNHGIIDIRHRTNRKCTLRF